MVPILSNLLTEAQGGRINFTATALERGIHCSHSSLLMLILLLWSVPILIYAVLFFPELKQLVLVGFGATSCAWAKSSSLPVIHLNHFRRSCRTTLNRI